MGRLLVYLFNLIFIVFLGWILSRILRGLFGSSRTHVRGSRSESVGGGDERVVRGETARDPVCGMFVSTEVSHRLTHGKETLHFCSRECLERYQSNASQS
jgi:YHS domain-containing protein